MSKRYQGLVLVGALLVSFGLGYLLAYNYHNLGNISQKPVQIDSKKDLTVEEDTRVILERIYSRCKHTDSQDFQGQKYLQGKSLDEIRKLYTFKEGYLVWFNEEGELIIHKRIDDWCPHDKNKRHLGTYKGYVTVFKGPAGYDDEIIRITRIKMESLPEKIQKDIAQGEMEFVGDDTLNDALESLDEYE